jgi:glutathione synthase/RimK-type ligase-like ATP-grasp enzyme
MKIAIHKSSWGFSSIWINYCKTNQIPYKTVNCYESNIISQLEDCDILMWHHHHTDAKDVLFAKGLLFALEQAGKKVFPNFNTGWHFDDKVGQKYLLEAINAPMAEAWVFFEKKDALAWIEKTTFPKVFKLRGGAGSTNVKLISSKKQAQKMVKKTFGAGFRAYDKWNDLKEQYLRYKQGKLTGLALAKSIRRVFVSTRFARTVGNQKGYIYFQEFIPNNDSDIRVITIGEKAFAIKRMTRPNDFRASGGGMIKFEKELIDERCIKIAFETSNKMNASCVAYDFVFDGNNNPLIVEINYGFAHEPYLNCPGYWDKDLNWHEGKFNQVEWILEEIIRETK